MNNCQPLTANMGKRGDSGCIQHHVSASAFPSVDTNALRKPRQPILASRLGAMLMTSYTMRNLTIILILINFFCDAYSQVVKLIDFQIRPDYSKNCRKIDDCMDKVKFNGDTLIIEILTQINSYSDPPLKESVKFYFDTLFLDYSSTPKIVDTIIQYDSIRHEFDTLLSVTMTIGMANDYFSRLTYKLHGFFQKPKNIKFQNRTINGCPTKALTYNIVDGDTVNLINLNGWKHGKWISKIVLDSVLSTKVKYYNNRKFIEGYIITENGDTTHCISETCIEMATPYELCR
jgi:hypothetical protein